MVERLLPGEVLLFTSRRHLLWLLVPLALILGAAVLAAVQVCPSGLPLRADGDCILVAATAGGFAALPFILEWATTRFILTNYRVIRRQAPAWVRTRELGIHHIHALSVRQSLLGRVLGYGELLVDSGAPRGGRIVLDFVPDPLRLRAEISAAAWAGGEV